MPCPQCGRPAALGPENKWRPFCSERCKLVDLGSWAAEDYRIAEPSAPKDTDDAATD